MSQLQPGDLLFFGSAHFKSRAIVYSRDPALGERVGSIVADAE